MLGPAPVLGGDTPLFLRRLMLGETVSRRTFLIQLGASMCLLRFGRPSESKATWLTDDIYPVPRATFADRTAANGWLVQLTQEGASMRMREAEERRMWCAFFQEMGVDVERACRVARSRVRPMRIVRWPSSSSAPAVTSPALADLASRSQRFATDGLAGVKG